MSTPNVSTPKKIDIDLGQRSYPVYIGASLLERLGELCAEHGLGRRTLVISNESVGGLYAPVVLKSLQQAGFDVSYVTIPDGEAYKNIETAASLYDACVDAGLDRSSFIVALGGGVIGDVAGFVAATYMRGIDVVQVPTTLLAQVDASVGGKTAVNHASAKNLIGAFHQPRLVMADVSTLVSLPPREYRAGLAEVVKHGLIADRDLFEFVEREWAALLRVAEEAVTHVVVRSVEIKGAVVSADERESGLRATLNYGHTVGHGIEAASEYALLHGEAISIGMVVEGRLSLTYGSLTPPDLERMKQVFERFDLPTRPAGYDFDVVLEAMTKDKKAQGGRLRFALLEQIGRAVVVDDVPVGQVKAAYLAP